MANGQYLRHKRINTFAVIPASADKNTLNLDKDSRYKDKLYFYSRRWEKSGFKDSELAFDYPTLTIVENQDTISKPFAKLSKHTVELAFYLSDLMPQKDSEVTDISEERTFEQIGADMRELFTQFNNELGQFYYSRYNDGTGFSPWGWYSLRWMESEGYTIEKQNALSTKLHVSELNFTPRYGFWGDNLADMPYFMIVEIDPCADSTPSFDYDYKTYRRLPDSPHRAL